MLKTKRNEHWEDADRAALPAMIVDGTVQATTQGLDTAIHPDAQPLPGLLQQPDLELVGEELLRRFQGLYVLGPDGTDPEWLYGRVTELNDEWKWPQPQGQFLRERVLWLSARLAELTGRTAQALRQYDLYVGEERLDGHLGLLSLNNRGVLRITRQGRAEGVEDLARAGIRTDPPRGDGRVMPQALPGSAFNLLNLVNICTRNDPLCYEVDRALRRYVKRVRFNSTDMTHWFGPGSGTWDEVLGGSAALIYHKPRRMAALLASLESAVEKGFAPHAGAEVEHIPSELQLWQPRQELDVAGRPADWQIAMARVDHASYAEAASVLYARDVPTTLSPPEFDFAHDERLVRDKLAQAERYLDERRFADAMLAAEYVVEALDGIEEPEEWVQAVRAQAKKRRDEAELRQKNEERFNLHRGYAVVAQQVEELEQETDAFRARQGAAEIGERVEALEPKFKEAWKDSRPRFAAVLGDLRRRADLRVEQLERGELAEKLAGPWRAFCEACPKNWHRPVGDEAYQALQKCRSIDPAQQVHNYDKLERQLNAHQARHLHEEVRRAILSETTPKWEDAEPMLARAVFLDPTLAPAVAPLACLLLRPPKAPAPATMGQIRRELLDEIGELLSQRPFDKRGAAFPAVQADFVRRAAEAMVRLSRSFLDAGGRLAELYRHLGRVFGLVLVSGRPETLEVVHTIFRRYLAACPDVAAELAAVADPRNPLRRLLEQGAIAELLAQGERHLNRAHPRRAKAAAKFAAAMEAGLRRPRELRRAVRGYALAEVFPKDPDLRESTWRQREVLAALDDWVGAMEARQRLACRDESVKTQVVQIKKQPRPTGAPARNGKPGEPAGEKAVGP